MKPQNHRKQPKRIMLKKHESIVSIMEQRIKHLEEKLNARNDVVRMLQADLVTESKEVDILRKSIKSAEHSIGHWENVCDDLSEELHNCKQDEKRNKLIIDKLVGFNG